MEDSEVQEICRKIYKSHKRALDLIFEYKPDKQLEIYECLVDIIGKDPDLVLDEVSSKSNVRFISEDLDFDTLGLKFEDFSSLLDYVKEGLHKEGISVEISSEKRNNLYIAELHFKDLMKLYGITDRRGLDLMIKIEVYRPKWGLQFEPGVLSLYGYNFSAVLLEKGHVFSCSTLLIFNHLLKPLRFSCVSFIFPPSVEACRQDDLLL